LELFLVPGLLPLVVPELVAPCTQLLAVAWAAEERPLLGLRRSHLLFPPVFEMPEPFVAFLLFAEIKRMPSASKSGTESLPDGSMSLVCADARRQDAAHRGLAAVVCPEDNFPNCFF
jgi:hypothetical protein